LHRLVYIKIIGLIPSGHVIMHTCDNKKCCNPAHLKLGTQKENIHDMITKDRTNYVRGCIHPNSKLTEEAIHEIRKCKLSQRTLATKYGVSRWAIQNIQLGLAYNNIPWK
jgi:hypothetical protein